MNLFTDSLHKIAYATDAEDYSLTDGLPLQTPCR